MLLPVVLDLFTAIVYGLSDTGDGMTLQMLTRLTRGRGIVISSGAAEACHLRGPPDVANLATFMGLSQQQGKVGSNLALMSCLNVVH